MTLQSALIPSPRQPVILIFITVALSYLECGRNGFLYCVVFHAWLFSLALEVCPCCRAFLFIADCYSIVWIYHLGFPGSSHGKESSCSAGDLGLIPGLGRSPGKRKGYPLQYSGLENSYTVHGVAKSQTQLSNFHFACTSELPTPLLPLPTSFTPLEATALSSISMSLFSTERFLSCKNCKDQTSVTHS